MIKKIMVALLSLTLTAGILVGCSSDDSSNMDSGSSLAEAQTALERITDIQNKLNDGADFDELMNNYSEDTGLAAFPDGYFFTKGKMVAEFENSAFSLEDGQVSDIVETSYGYHILKKIAKGEYISAHLDEVKGEYLSSLFTEKIKEKSATLTPEYSQGYDEIGIRSFDAEGTEYQVELPTEVAGTRFTNDVIVTANGFEVPTNLYKYAFINLNLSDYDKGDQSYWLTNADKLDALKKETVDYVLEYFTVIEVLAAENNVALTGEDLKAVDVSVEEAIAQLGGQQGFDSFLVYYNLDLDTYKRILGSDSLAIKVYDVFYGDASKVEVAEQDLLEFYKDYVAIKHILILFEQDSTDVTN